MIKKSMFPPFEVFRVFPHKKLEINIPRVFFKGAIIAFLAMGVVPHASGLEAENSGSGQPDKYLIGGPLAGLKLPVSPQNTGRGPEVLLYPNSVEHWRAYYMKYLPSRSFFDEQSQVKNWMAPNIPGAKKDQVEQYISPIYRQPKNGEAKDTGEKLPPVPVIRCKAGDPVFKLDLGELGVGMYALRVIGAVPTDKLRRFREPLFLSLKINDGLKGETNTYRIRTGYVDEFYSVGDFYFHAMEKRPYTAEISVDRGTTVDLLVHNITLDDVLAGTERRAIKTRRTLMSDAEVEDIKAGKTTPPLGYADNQEMIKYVAKFPALSPEERLARDEAIWKRTPPLNAPSYYSELAGGHDQWYPGEAGAEDKTLPQIEEQFGRWEPVNKSDGLDVMTHMLSRDPAVANAFLENKKLGLKYTSDDLITHKALPDPYPYKDDGAGLYFPDPKDPTKGRVLAPIAEEVGRRYRENTTAGFGGAWVWLVTGNSDFARDGAMELIRQALQFPALETGDMLDGAVCIPNYLNWDAFCRQRIDYALWMAHYALYEETLKSYDMLYDYIKGNEELAKSVQRFVPWVKTSEDIIQLLDVYLVQTTAKRIMRYHYYTLPAAITDTATVLGDREVTTPWMEWQFSRTFNYPYPVSGLQDLIVTTCDREGADYRGSTYYCQGEGGVRFVEPLERYLDAIKGEPQKAVDGEGTNKSIGISKLDFFSGDKINSSLYPKPLAQANWQLNTVVAGADFIRFGAVTGPDKGLYFTLGKVGEANIRAGWRWSGDPKYAWMLKNLYKHGDESDAEWKKITEAADTVKRAPWLDLPSRHLENWCGILETGLQHDDFRFRRAAYVRTGSGIGHAHADALTLQFNAHGLPMTAGGGQRGEGYTKPSDDARRTHNTVEALVDSGKGWGFDGYSWLKTLSDAPGARYLYADSDLPSGTKLFQRQVALIDVDEGKGSEPLPTNLQLPEAKLKAGVTTANSYIFDVFRVSGGKLHSYGFHGPVNDDFQWNVKNPQPVAESKNQESIANDADFLAMFTAQQSKQAGDTGDTFEATWRMSRDPEMIGTENYILKQNFDPNSPPKYTRLIMLGTEGMHALKADLVSQFEGFKNRQYHFTQTMLQRRSEDGNLETAFAALIEPYAGKPFIASQKLLQIPGNQSDALRAVAVEVKLTEGRNDLCFGDGYPEMLRTMQSSNGSYKISGEFAFHSSDDKGLCETALTGGTQFEGPDVRMSMPSREYRVKIVKVDYLKKTFWTDEALPTNVGGEVFEIIDPGCHTTYTIASVADEGKRSRVTVTGGADFYRSAVQSVDSGTSEVVGAIDLPHGRATHVAGMTLSNDTQTKTWRLAKNHGTTFTVEGAVDTVDFQPSGEMRLWEYGVGDTVRLATQAWILRTEPGIYKVWASSDLRVALNGSKLEFSGDGKTWQPLGSKASGGWVEAKLPAAKFATPVFLRVTR